MSSAAPDSSSPMAQSQPSASSPSASSPSASTVATSQPPTEEEMKAALALQKRTRALEAHSSLQECRGCSNKAKRDCANQCCKTCCSMTKKPCPSHQVADKPAKASANESFPHPEMATEYSASSRSRASEYVVPIADNYPNDPSATIGSCVIGAVEGHCSSGLLVQVLIGGWVLHGVLFDEPASIEIAQLPNAATIRSEALMIAPEPSTAMVYESPMTHFHSITKITPPYIPNEPAPVGQFNQYQNNVYNSSNTYQHYQPDEHGDYMHDDNGLKRARPSAGFDDSESRPKRTRKLRTGPNGPKGPRSAYIYFQAAVRAKLQTAPESEHPAILTQWDWTRITEDEKKPYYLMADADKQRFDRELAEHLKNNPEVAQELVPSVLQSAARANDERPTQSISH